MADQPPHRAKGTSVALPLGTQLKDFEITGLIAEGR